MPVYEYLCEHDHKSQTIRTIEERNDPAFCPTCGKPARLTVSAPVLPSIAEIPKHFNESLGMVIESRDHLRYVQNQRGCEDFDPSYLANRPTSFYEEQPEKIDTTKYWVDGGA